MIVRQYHLGIVALDILADNPGRQERDTAAVQHRGIDGLDIIGQQVPPHVDIRDLAGLLVFKVPMALARIDTKLEAIVIHQVFRSLGLPVLFEIGRARDQ